MMAAAITIPTAGCAILTFAGMAAPMAAAVSVSPSLSSARARLASRKPLIMAPPTVSGCCVQRVGS